MRKLVLVLLAVLAAVSVSAQTLDKPTRISVFGSNPFYWSEGNGMGAGYGVAIERRFSNAWSGELAVGSETHRVQLGFFNPTRYELRTHPIDVVARYSFAGAHLRWRSYVGAGARYVAAPEEPPNREYDNELSPQVSAGVEFNSEGSFSLRFDLKQLVQEDSSDFDEWLKFSIACGWRF
jgi:outer membrane protein W